MTNRYEVHGDVTTIILDHRDGSVFEALIDTDDLPRAKSVPGKWFAQRDNSSRTMYVRTNIRRPDGSRYRPLLHRWLLDVPDGMEVDHIDHNGLNNKRSNLRICSRAENSQNRKGAYSNSTSGFRGVHWHKATGKWRARVIVDGTEHVLGYFDDPREAARVVSAGRAELMPYSSDATRRDERRRLA